MWAAVTDDIPADQSGRLVDSDPRAAWTARLVGPMQVWTTWYFACSVLSGAVGERVAGRVKPVVAG